MVLGLWICLRAIERCGTMWLRRGVAGEDELGPPLCFGDYLHRAHWFAVVPEGAQQPVVSDEEYFSYDGSLLRMMWDEDAGPLWTLRALPLTRAT